MVILYNIWLKFLKLKVFSCEITFNCENKYFSDKIYLIFIFLKTKMSQILVKFRDACNAFALLQYWLSSFAETTHGLNQKHRYWIVWVWLNKIDKCWSAVFISSSIWVLLCNKYWKYEDRCEVWALAMLVVNLSRQMHTYPLNHLLTVKY